MPLLSATGSVVRYLKEIGVALVVAFIVGVTFLFGQLVYAQLVVMPGLITSGKGVLAVGVDLRWAARVATIAFVAYVTWQMWSSRQRR